MISPGTGPLMVRITRQVLRAISRDWAPYDVNNNRRGLCWGQSEVYLIPTQSSHECLVNDGVHGQELLPSIEWV